MRWRLTGGSVVECFYPDVLYRPIRISEAQNLSDPSTVWRLKGMLMVSLA
jgi:hypothetical protein